ncbi:MAG TPA: hypothetical protein VIC57_18915 [Candidatus Dormibacteraeota bacterium]
MAAASFSLTVRSWGRDLELRRWWIVEGLRIFLVVAGLALAAAAIEVVAVAGQFPGFVTGRAGDDVARLLVVQWSLTYFGAHLVPVDLGGVVTSLAASPLAAIAAGGAGQPGSLAGLGSLTLLAIVVWLGFRTGGWSATPPTTAARRWPRCGPPSWRCRTAAPAWSCSSRATGG